MSRRKCSYFNCNNIQKNTNNTFHTFPSDTNLLKKWIINSGNIELDAISPNKLKNQFLCSEHFEKNQYSNPLNPKLRLNANAIPKKYCEVEHIDISIPAVNILNSPKSWDWNVSSIDNDQELQPQKYDNVNEVLITTPKKVKKNRNTIEEADGVPPAGAVPVIQNVVDPQPMDNNLDLDMDQHFNDPPGSPPIISPPDLPNVPHSPDNRNTCMTCLVVSLAESAQHYIVLPCGHAWVCNRCVMQLEQQNSVCPMCRAENITLQRVFFS